MHFGENQLSRSLIGLSPLPTAHPLHFQLKWVRSSTTSYRRFNLAMGRSLRFGSRSRHCNALFRLAFATATPHRLTSPRATNSQAHSSKGTPSPLHDRSRRLRRIVSTRFQVLFHSPPGVLFTFPSRYWFTIGRQGIFRLTGWSPQIHASLLGPGVTWVSITEAACVSDTGLLPTPAGLSRSVLLHSSLVTLWKVWCPSSSVPLPHDCNATRLGTVQVWSVPFSLAATQGIAVAFFS